MYFVYLIRSLSNTEQVYVGCTLDLKKRLSNHNSGTSDHTAKYTPWELVVYVCFKDKARAFEFEKYLKSGSGREFVTRRLL